MEITKEEYKYLLTRDMQLTHLEEMGVDNWSNYSVVSGKECWNCEKETNKRTTLYHPIQDRDIKICTECLNDPIFIAWCKEVRIK